MKVAPKFFRTHLYLLLCLSALANKLYAQDIVNFAYLGQEEFKVDSVVSFDNYFNNRHPLYPIRQSDAEIEIRYCIRTAGRWFPTNRVLLIKSIGNKIYSHLYDVNRQAQPNTIADVNDMFRSSSYRDRKPAPPPWAH